MRAILITIAQATKDLAITLSPSEASALLKHQHWPPLSVEDSPVFGNSPLGTALEQTFSRLMKERQNAPDQELRPAILIVSDGLPTDAKLIDPLALAEKIKRSGTPIVCCFVTNRNIGHPWKLRRKPRRWWPRAARLMFSMASSLEEWPEFTHSLVKSRFKAKKHAKFFIQVNHTEHLQNFIEAFILPVESEQQRLR